MAPRVGPNRTALVTDDDALVRRVVGMALESEGWTVIEAADAHAERAALEDVAIALCVMDRHLPGPDLDARIDDVGRLRPDAAVLVLSGDPAASAAGVVQLAKPVDLDTFRRGVEHALSLARARA